MNLVIFSYVQGWDTGIADQHGSSGLWRCTLPPTWGRDGILFISMFHYWSDCLQGLKLNLTLHNKGKVPKKFTEDSVEDCVCVCVWATFINAYTVCAVWQLEKQIPDVMSCVCVVCYCGCIKEWTQGTIVIIVGSQQEQKVSFVRRSSDAHVWMFIVRIPGRTR